MENMVVINNHNKQKKIEFNQVDFIFIIIIEKKKKQ